MSDTYCGKSCAECTYKESLPCPGCREGLGRPHYGECEIAKCCRERGLAACEGCSPGRPCPLMNKDSVPEDVLRQRRERQAFEAHIGEIAPKLSRRLMIVFWLLIAIEAYGLLVAFLGLFQTYEQPMSWLNTADLILRIGYLTGFTVVLFTLSPFSAHFRKAAFTHPAIILVSLLAAVLPESTILFLLLALLSIAANCLFYYSESSGFMEITSGLDDKLSAYWQKLRKWQLILTIALPFASLLITRIGSSLVNMALGIIRYFLIYETYALYRLSAVSFTPEAKG